MVERTMAIAPLGPYQPPTAIAAVHAEAPSTRTPTGGRSWVRAHLLEFAGEREQAREHYRSVAKRTVSSGVSRARSPDRGEVNLRESLG
ncbi:MAG TPA: hypothetical protein VHH15_06700 [Actinophytocola sp.]|nr:hypothetical protein [Actinophytocola sp.]